LAGFIDNELKVQFVLPTLISTRVSSALHREVTGISRADPSNLVCTDQLAKTFSAYPWPKAPECRTDGEQRYQPSNDERVGNCESILQLQRFPQHCGNPEMVNEQVKVFSQRRYFNIV